MKVNGKPYRTIWLAPDGKSVEIIDQTKFPASLRDRDARDASMMPRVPSRTCWCAARH